MNYDLTEERKRYLETRGYTILSACPGSGKTTSIVKKLFDVSRYCTEQYGGHAGFACLSFTNKACEELVEKYHDMHGEALRYPNLVSTIDSFVMQYVVMPFWYLCKQCKAKPVEVLEKEALLRVYQNFYPKNGRLQSKVVDELKAYSQLLYKHHPAEIYIEKDHFKWKKKKVTETNLKNYCKTAFLYRLNKGYITSSDAVWIACQILENNKDVAQALASRFPYIIVDEAQDNSELQFYFFSLLKDAGLANLEYVGDFCQAIYDFRNARPDLMQNLIHEEGWNVLHLTECRRSIQRIINVYSLLKSIDVPSITSYQVEDKGIPIIVYKKDDGNIREIIRDFYAVCDNNDLRSRMILARGNNACKKLGGVKDVDFKFWKSHWPYLIIEAKHDFENGIMRDAFRKIRFVVADLIYGDKILEKKDFIRSIEKDIDFNAKIYSFFGYIPELELSFSDWSDQTEELLKQYWELPEKPVFEAHSRTSDKDGNKIKDIANFPVARYHQSCKPDSKYHKSVDTIHAVKGATLDAVLLFLSENSQGTAISLNDFLSGPIERMTESQRLIYVACSRATQFLALAVPSTVPDETIKSALRGIEFDVKSPGLQTELVFQ